METRNSEDDAVIQFPPHIARGTPRMKVAWAEANASRLGINWELLPSIPLWLKPFGREDKVRSSAVTAVVNASKTIRRPLTQPETDALTYYRAKHTITTMHTYPLIILSVAFFVRRGAATFRFPFYQPKKSFNPNVFPGQRMPFVKGPWARFQWHFARVGAYALMSQLFIGGFVHSHATSTYMVNLNADPRLEEFRVLVQKVAEALRTQQQNQQKTFPASHEPGDSFATTIKKAQALEEEGRRAYRAARLEQQRLQQEEQGGPPPQAPFSQQSSPPETQSYQSSSDDDYYSFDDASPVAQSEQRRRQQPQTLSAWERIRQQSPQSTQASSAPQDQKPRRTWSGRRKDASFPSDAQETNEYSFSSAEEDKSDAKSQAQKEFDDMLEKERRGESDTRR